MNILQEKMLGMLCEIDEICRKHEIKYCLFAGSGLGAERHGGFIPWDDDADIVMTLENYEKFLKAFETERKEGRVLNCLEKSSEYPFTYARYVDTTTTAIQRHTAFGGCDPGIKIDIFVFVPTYDELSKAEKHRLEILAFSETICPYAIMHYQRPEGFENAYKKEKKLYDRLGREKYIKKRMAKLKNRVAKGTKKYVLFSGMLSNSYIIDADIMDNIEYIKFEDTELPVSTENVRFSKELYGERWISKPQRVEDPRHTYLLDINRPYREYMDLLWQTCDFVTIERNVSTRHGMHIFERDHFKDVLINNQRLRNLAVEQGMNNVFEKLTPDERTNWRYLYDLFEEYYSTQLKSNNRHYGLFIRLNSQTFEAAINATVMTDKYYEAADIMSIGISSGELPYSAEMQKSLLNRINICREITETMYIKKDFNKLKTVIENITDDMVKESLTLVIAGLWLRVISASPDDLGEICDKVDQLSDRYGETGELLAVKGYCLEKKGNADRAVHIYEKAAGCVRNGYMYQWLADKGYSTYEYKYE